MLFETLKQIHSTEKPPKNEEKPKYNNKDHNFIPGQAKQGSPWL